jgi:hypothetical protein
MLAASLAMSASACVSFWELPIEVPIKPKLDVTPFERVLVAHGEPLEANAADVFRRAFAPYLGS